MNHKITSIALFTTLAVVLLSSCEEPENSPGYEYMPDMYRSPAVEAYVDYGMDPFFITEDSAKKQRETMSARLPVPGSIPFTSNSEMAMLNFPYPYKLEDYELAGKMVKNPLKLTKARFDEGKTIYTKFCVHCHGTSGNGDGPVVEIGGHSPPNPYTHDNIKNLPEGKLFHSITMGKGYMGSHAQQLSQEERWKVIFYVQALQQGKDTFTEPTAIAAVVEEVVETGDMLESPEEEVTE